MSYTVERATAADVTALVDQRLAFQRELGRDPDAEPALREALAAYFAAELDRTLVAFLARDEATGEVVGSVFFVIVVRVPGGRHGNGRMGLVLNVYTAPEHRRQGLARRLMMCLLEAAREADLARLELTATPAGRRLYEELGFMVDAEGLTPMELIMSPAATSTTAELIMPMRDTLALITPRPTSGGTTSVTARGARP